MTVRCSRKLLYSSSLKYTTFGGEKETKNERPIDKINGKVEINLEISSKQ